ncbi:hypothetical protein PLANPX_4538 [Lacipirellula parvula]|uniref:Uncharacterized protein n=1 Tax=Lacipirellula parvula TaxID=2650471 RepID=A0A5K7XKB6_9BACT|nr:hypothetical protein PLANPX_4538 [Lacipirellula parvula]
MAILLAESANLFAREANGRLKLANAASGAARVSCECQLQFCVSCCEDGVATVGV